MAPEYRNNNWIPNFFFVDMPETDSKYIYRMERRNAAHQLSGMLKVRLVTVDPLFIGSGFQELEDGQFVKQTLTENGRPIIPGSGLKGAVRQICRAVSYSCVPKEKIRMPRGTFSQCKNEREAKFDSGCIVCDMFGKMGWSSKVFFSDLIAESGETIRCRAAQQFPPHPEAEKYLDGDNCHAYKFYKTKIDSVTKPQNDLLRAVPPKAVFTGEITYRNLEEQELELLLFALGQTKTISLKIGGYRNEKFGTVNLELTSADIPDIKAKAQKYKEYMKQDNGYPNDNIERLEDKMPYIP